MLRFLQHRHNVSEYRIPPREHHQRRDADGRRSLRGKGLSRKETADDRKEELVDNKGHGLLAHKLAKGPKKLVIVPNITHYGIYHEARGRAQKETLDWFDEHLKK